MKRPHSAKPIRTFVPQVLAQDGSIDEPKHFLKSGKRHLMSAVSMSNDLSRLLPKKIQHDKEQLYHENLQLKTALNQATQENLRLKTKVALFQREKDRLHKTDNHGLSKGKSSNNLIAKPEVIFVLAQKQNGIVVGLKKIVREVRQENQSLNVEINKLKKSLKYTKLNQFEVQRQTIYEQNKKLAKLVQQYEVQLTSRIQNQKQFQHLQAELNEKTRTLKQVTSDNIRYQEILQQVEAQYRQTSEKLLIQEKKWQRNFAVQKRKFDQLNKHVESLRQEVKTLNQRLQEEKKKNQQKKVLRPASSHPYQSTADAERNKQLKEKQEAIQVNSRLKLQLQEAKKKLMQSENRLKINSKNVTNTLQLSKNQTFELNLTKEEPNISKHKQQSNQQEEYYGSDFEQNSSKVPQLNSRPINQKQKNKVKTETKISPIILQIKKLLTYRLKYNRYTFQELKADIEVSPESTFIYQDLLNMLIAEPFYLTSYYAQEFLRVCYGRKDIQNDDELELKDLVIHLRSVIDDFELKEQEQEESMLYKIAENLTHNRKALEVAFGKIKDKNNSVPQSKLQRVLRQVSKLSEEEIDLAICYVSINTETLQAINFIDFLDRFYINNSQSLSNKQAARLEEDDLSMGENQNIDESELIADDELV